MVADLLHMEVAAARADRATGRRRACSTDLTDQPAAVPALPSGRRGRHAAASPVDAPRAAALAAEPLADEPVAAAEPVAATEPIAAEPLPGTEPIAAEPIAVRPSEPVPRTRREALAAERAAHGGRPQRPQPLPAPDRHRHRAPRRRRRPLALTKPPARPAARAEGRPRVIPVRALAGVAVVALAGVGSALAQREAVLGALHVPADPRDLVRHALQVWCLGLVVLVLRGQLRAARRPGSGALLAWLVATLPLVTQAALAATQAWHPGRGLVPPNPAAWWLLLANPGLVAAVALALPTGPQPARDRRARLAPGLWAAAIALGWAVLVTVRARSMPSSVGDGMTLAFAVTGMLLTSALVATSRLPLRSRWTRAVLTALPTVAAAAVPTLVCEPQALVPAQSWTVVLYPLLCLAAAAAAIVVTGVVDLAVSRARAASPAGPPAHSAPPARPPAHSAPPAHPPAHSAPPAHPAAPVAPAAPVGQSGAPLPQVEQGSPASGRRRAPGLPDEPGSRRTVAHDSPRRARRVSSAAPTSPAPKFPTPAMPAPALPRVPALRPPHAVPPPLEAPRPGSTSLPPVPEPRWRTDRKAGLPVTVFATTWPAAPKRVTATPGELFREMPARPDPAGFSSNGSSSQGTGSSRTEAPCHDRTGTARILPPARTTPERLALPVRRGSHVADRARLPTSGRLVMLRLRPRRRRQAGEPVLAGLAWIPAPTGPAPTGPARTGPAQTGPARQTSARSPGTVGSSSVQAR